MRRIWIAVIAIVVLILSWAIATYNALVKQQEAVTTAWGQVENVYQRRADLVPNIVEVVKQHTEFEQATLIAVTEARAKATSVKISGTTDLTSFEHVQDGLTESLGRLLVTAEGYPDLKANEEYLGLQAQLTGCENRIAIERGRFNVTAMHYNQKVRHFPSNIIASLFGFKKHAYFEATTGNADKAPKTF